MTIIQLRKIAKTLALTSGVICCKDCNSYTFTFTADEPGADIPVYYTDCETGNFVKVYVPAPYNPITVCATVYSAIAVVPAGIGGTATVVDNGAC